MIKCPNCGRGVIRARRKDKTLVCIRCGYSAPKDKFKEKVKPRIKVECPECHNKNVRYLLTKGVMVCIVCGYEGKREEFCSDLTKRKAKVE